MSRSIKYVKTTIERSIKGYPIWIDTQTKNCIRCFKISNKIDHLFYIIKQVKINRKRKFITNFKIKYPN